MPKTKTLTQRAARSRKTPAPPATPDAIETAAPLAPAPRPTKLAIIVDLASRPDGARVEELMAATGWQAHSVRGALSGGVKKQLKLNVTSEKTEAGRVYRVVGEAKP